MSARRTVVMSIRVAQIVAELDATGRAEAIKSVGLEAFLTAAGAGPEVHQAWQAKFGYADTTSTTPGDAVGRGRLLISPVCRGTGTGRLLAASGELLDGQLLVGRGLAFEPHRVILSAAATATTSEPQ